MILIQYSHSQNIHNIQIKEFKTFKNSKYVSKSQIFKSHLLARCKWGVMHMTYKTKLYLMIQETKA